MVAPGEEPFNLRSGNIHTGDTPWETIFAADGVWRQRHGRRDRRINSGHLATSRRTGSSRLPRLLGRGGTAEILMFTGRLRVEPDTAANVARIVQRS